MSAEPGTPNSDEAGTLRHAGQRPSSTPHSTKEKLNKMVDHPYSQAFFLILALGHCLAYLEEYSKIEYMLVWTGLTGISLFVLTVSEVLIRVWTQGKPLCDWRSWRRWNCEKERRDYFRSWFHCAEFLAAALCVIHAVRYATVFFRYLSQALNPEDQRFAIDKLIVLVVVGYRAIRIWGIFYRSSSQAPEKQRKVNTVWMTEHLKEKAEHERRLMVRMERLVDRWPCQLALITLVVVHSLCYGFSRSNFQEQSQDILDFYYETSIYTAFMMMALFSIELVIRVSAQGGEVFFTPNLHKAELLCLTVGLVILGYATGFQTLYREELKAQPQRKETVGFLSASFFIACRALRLLGIYFEVSGAHWYASSLRAAVAQKNFMTKFNEVLEVPPQNLRITAGEIWIQKVQLKREAFQELHLPFCMRACLIEELQIKIPQPFDDPPILKFRLHNLLLLVEPGLGLAEAGGLEPHGTYWTYESVLKAKAKICTLIFKRLRLPRKHMSRQRVSTEFTDICSPDSSLKDVAPRASGTELQFQGSVLRAADRAGDRAKKVATTARIQALRALDVLKQKAKAMMKNRVTCVEVSIKNVAIQCHDQNSLGHGPMTLGFRLGKLIAKMDVKSLDPGSLRIDVARVGVYMDLMSSHRNEISAHFQAMAKAVEEPEQAIRELKRFGHIECFKLWAFESMERVRPLTDRQRHRRNERYHDHCFLFTLWKMDLDARDAVDEGLDGADRSRSRCESSASKLLTRFRIGTKLSLEQGIPEGIREGIRQGMSGIKKFSHEGRKGSKDFQPSESKCPTWAWKMHVTPLRFAIDSKQAQGLHTVLDCVQSWMALDEAFRWRPNVSYGKALSVETNGAEQSPQAEHRMEVSREDIAPEERAFVSQLWWIYAIHRVLAQIRMKPRIPFISAFWHSTAVAHYRTLLSELSTQPGGYEALLNGGPRWEVRLLHELQVRLPLFDIIELYKGTTVVVRKQTRMADSERSVSSMTMAQRMTRLYGSIMPKAKSKHDIVVIDCDTPAAPYFSKIESGSSYHDESSSGVVSHQMSGDLYSIFSTVLGEEDDVFQVEDIPTPLENSVAARLNVVAGTWAVDFAGFEFRILQVKSTIRSVLIHMRLDDMCIDADISVPATEDSMDYEDVWAAKSTIAQLSTYTSNGKEDSRIAVTATVKHFGVNCPEAGPLIFGGGTHICTVMKPVFFPRTPFHSSNMIIGRKVDYSHHLALRAVVTPSEPGVWETHVGSMRAVLHEPLYLFILQHFIKARHRSVPLGQGFSIRTADICRNQSDPIRKELSIGKKLSVANVDFVPHTGNMTLKNGRVFGIAKVKHFQAFTNFTEQFGGLPHEELQAIRNVRRNLRRLTQVRRKFELMSGIRGGLLAGWSVYFHIGALHGVQVGVGSESSVLVDEYRWHPFITVCTGSKVGDLTRQGQTHRMIAMESSSFKTAPTFRWEDDCWLEQAPCTPASIIVPMRLAVPSAPSLVQPHEDAANTRVDGWPVNLRSAVQALLNSRCCVPDEIPEGDERDSLFSFSIEVPIESSNLTPRISAREGQRNVLRVSRENEHVESDTETTQKSAKLIHERTEPHPTSRSRQSTTSEEMTVGSFEVLVRVMPRERFKGKWLVQESWRWQRIISTENESERASALKQQATFARMNGKLPLCRISGPGKCDMNFTEVTGYFNGLYTCDLCGTRQLSGRHWHCPHHFGDYCKECSSTMDGGVTPV